MKARAAQQQQQRPKRHRLKSFFWDVLHLLFFFFFFSSMRQVSGSLFFCISISPLYFPCSALPNCWLILYIYTLWRLRMCIYLAQKQNDIFGLCRKKQMDDKDDFTAAEGIFRRADERATPELVFFRALSLKIYFAFFSPSFLFLILSSFFHFVFILYLLLLSCSFLVFRRILYYYPSFFFLLSLVVFTSISLFLFFIISAKRRIVHLGTRVAR